MKKLIYTGIILLILCINTISINNQFNQYANNAYTIEISDETKKINQVKVLEEMSNTHDVELLSVEFYKGMTFYINDFAYSRNNLSNTTLYTNGIAKNRVNIPLIEKIQIKPWSLVEENKKFSTENTYLKGDEENIYAISQALDEIGVESTIMRARYKSNIQYYFFIGIALNLLIYIVFAFIDINRNQKKIMLYKLNGLGIKEYIARDITTVKNVLLKGTLLALIAVTTTMLVTHNLKISVLFVGILITILYMFISLLMYYGAIAKLLNTSKIDTLIRGEVFIVKTTEFLKGILFTSKTILFVVLAIATIGVTTILSNIDELNLWKKVSDYYVIENVAPVKYTTREKQEEDYNNIADFQERLLFVKYIEENFQGAYAYTLSNEFSDNFDRKDIISSVIVANSNFLQLSSFDVVESENAILYIPEEYQNYQSDITSAIDKYFTGVASNDLEYTLNYEVIQYQEDSIYSYKYDDGAVDIYQNPIIYIPGTNSEEYNIYVYAHQELMYYDNPEDDTSSLEKYYETYDYQLEKGVDDITLSKFAEYSQPFYTQLKVLISSLIILIISMIISIYVFVDVIKSYIRVNRTKFLMKKLSGETSYVIYKKIYNEEIVYWCINLVIGLVALILVCITKSYSISNIAINAILYVLLLIIVQLLYFVVLRKVIYKVENSEIYIAIKGKE